MEPYQERVVEEKRELDKRIASLFDFMENGQTYFGLVKNERDRLYDQYLVMKKYSNILNQRIIHFDVSKQKGIKDSAILSHCK